jgi:hypothetical protein
MLKIENLSADMPLPHAGECAKPPEFQVSTFRGPPEALPAVAFVL